MNIMLAGGTGFIGGRAREVLLRAAHRIDLLTRNPDRIEKSTSLLAVHAWDGRSRGSWTNQMAHTDAVINLSGESIAAGRWTHKRKEALLRSRIDSTRALVEAMREAERKPGVLINASAVGYYGHVPEGDVTELSASGNGFLPELCRQWEMEASRAETLGVRVVRIRFGVVLGRGGGALEKMIPPFTFFAGGPLGSGRQWFPWVHRDDVVAIIQYALTHANVSGPVNATAPHPVTMKEFCSAFGRALHRPSWAPVPGFMLKLLLGEMSEMLLTGQRAIPERLLSAGYSFRYPTVDKALSDIF